jgi:2-succinyl-6-hydroxy-2,4-cyclohexadiene-1-carboxylate synthase
MGGRLALHLALGHPESVAGLVLIGATPGIVEEVERADRRRADEALARKIRAEPIDVFLDGWLAKPLFAGLTPAAAARAARRRNRPEGLAASLESCGTGTQQPLWNRLAELEVPVLLITGSGDAKFTDLAERMAAELSNAAVTTVSLPGTHAVHLERPEEAADAVLGWLASL